MEIKKAGQSYDKYALTVSYGELDVLINALKNNSTGAMADEMLHAMEWYSERLPEPGSEETSLKELDDKDGESEEDGKDETSAVGRETPGDVDSYIDQPPEEDMNEPEYAPDVNIDTSLVKGRKSED